MSYYNDVFRMLYYLLHSFLAWYLSTDPLVCSKIGTRSEKQLRVLSVEEQPYLVRCRSFKFWQVMFAWTIKTESFNRLKSTFVARDHFLLSLS